MAPAHFHHRTNNQRHSTEAFFGWDFVEQDCRTDNKNKDRETCMQCDVSLNVIQEEWGWAFDGTVDRVVDVSLFGNVLVKSDENIYHIIPEDLTVCCLCAVTDAGSVLNDPSFVHDWEMLHWVKLAQDAHGQLPNGKVIAFKLPRTLGGKDEPSNMYYADVNDYIGGMGQIARQIKDLPEGAEIRIKVE